MKQTKLLFGILIFSMPLLGTSQIIFEENFDGNQLNMENWSYEEGDGCPGLCGWGNNERQIYDRKYVNVENGKLVIEATKKNNSYYSGKINSKEKVEFQYGIIEIRAKLPKGSGIWPALWMLGSNIDEVGWPTSGEIDLMEYIGRKPHTIYNSLHMPAYHGDHASSKKTVVKRIEEGFHIYKTIWTRDKISFFIDGKPSYTYIPENYDLEEFPFRQDFYFLINMAIGGNFGGPEVDDSIFPVRFYLDYIKVYK